MGYLIKTEQWNLLGDCRCCRKEGYCTKPCKAHKRKVRNDMSRIIAKHVVDFFEKSRGDKSC